MSCKIISATTIGLEGHLITVEADILRSLFVLSIVGLPDSAVSESRERVISAIKNSGFDSPRTRTVVNLAPADIKKEGSIFDLPIALSILVASNQLLEVPDRSLFLGELSLAGEVRPIKGVLPIAMTAKEKNISTLFVPQENTQEACLVSGLKVVPVKNLSDLVMHLRQEIKLPSAIRKKPPQAKNKYQIDFQDVKGQHQAKRALTIAAAGNHNVAMTGPPGTGKTLLAKAFVGILPRLSEQEALEVTKLYSIAGRLNADSPLVQTRPFRSPHHTASAASLIGGGRIPKPGEISLAHHGCLFLDELPEFPRSVLETLRQPLEDGVITVSRVSGHVDYPARFILIAASNPCPCGFKNDPEKICTCSQSMILNYQKRVSGPLMDRIDIHLYVRRVPFDNLTQKEHEGSAAIQAKVEQARQIQYQRQQKPSALLGPREIEQYCSINGKTRELFKQIIEKHSLSARAYTRILKVARTIADLEGEKNIQKHHLLEAVGYRVDGV